MEDKKKINEEALENVAAGKTLAQAKKEPPKGCVIQHES